MRKGDPGRPAGTLNRNAWNGSSDEDDAEDKNDPMV
jgi:hypothetical protein